MAKDTVRTMTPTEAWLYAATWGSYMTAGDPGACMYGFDEKFVMQSEEHRQDCLDWIDNECLPVVAARPDDFDEGEADALARFRATCEAAEVVKTD